MIGTHTQPSPTSSLLPHLSQEATPLALPTSEANHYAKSSRQLLNKHLIAHHPKAGLNPLVDAASLLFSVMGDLKYAAAYRQLHQLQHELVQEINQFQEAIAGHNYNAEYTLISRYILCATLDDVIANTPWGGQGQWDNFSLLATFNQDAQHQIKFFTILERSLKEPSVYIDLMEFIYICLSMGYKGQYRGTEHSQFQLEQITNNLYKHIRAFRGSFSKMLSPAPIKTPKAMKKSLQSNNVSLLFIFFITACMMMTIFIGLNYLMDVISNEAYKNISQIKTTVSHDTAKQ
jgi:type VI secretion system protein ImpK